MSESDGERTARSVALEQAYVHEVYEQCAEKTAQSRHWPRIYRFLEELEPGALVCDIGCGNGKYLSVNQSIFKVGADRCKHLTDIAREKENEVLICDNLSLPFRDDSFDAVLSIAVVHHFATTERRVHALKELARVLRIGGRLVISVWAMEQRHRKFESQDVLVPWPKAYRFDSSSTERRSSGIPYADEIRYNRFAPKDFVTSKRNGRRKYGSKSYWIDPVLSPSPSSSSLSSPNETCYSFVRRALQKLAGGKRGGPGNRPWFLETWSHGSGKDTRHDRRDDSGDVDDLPIELRRLEDINVMLDKFPDTLSVKSKSLGDILEIQRLNLVRSRSSIPGLCSTLTSDTFLNETTETPSIAGSKPKLVKQKSHFIEDICLEISDNTAIRELIKDIPELGTVRKFPARRGNVQKQSSLNEELMSTDRLKEKEKIRRNIMKQASLNEEIICKRKAFEAFKDSLYSGNATKRFQLLKSGLTNRIKQSTTNIEKVSGMSIKNGFVKMLQGGTSGENEEEDECFDSVPCELLSPKYKPVEKPSPVAKKDAESAERRLSREDGSDSSKDSSLQSDTSVDSEDSFASVIYVPKQDLSSIIDAISAPPGYQLRATSAPPSPRVKHPPDLMGPRLKLIPISPLLKQFPATSKSLPPTSPPGLSPRTLNSAPPRPFFGAFPSGQQTSVFEKLLSGGEPESSCANRKQIPEPRNSEIPDSSALLEDSIVAKEAPTMPLTPVVLENAVVVAKVTNTDKVPSKEEKSLVPVIGETSFLREKPCENSDVELTVNEENSRRARLNQIKELLRQKPGFATRCGKPSFPLVRRASAATPGRLETVTRPLPRLLSLELFNPETDDLDSDSSGVSSPESIGSVISVVSDERFVANKDNGKADAKEQGASLATDEKPLSSGSKHPEFSHLDNNSAYELLGSASLSGSSTEISLASSQSIRLLEAAADVASSLEDAVETAIQLKPHSTKHATKAQKCTTVDDPFEFTESWRNVNASPSELQELLYDSKPNSVSPEEKTWDEECRRHLINFTEKLSENLIHDIDQYCQKTVLEFNEDFNERSVDRDPCATSTDSKVDDSLIIDSPLPSNKHPPGNGKLATCKYSELVDTRAWLNASQTEDENSKSDNKPSDTLLELRCSNADRSSPTVINNVLRERSSSEDIVDLILVPNSKKFIIEEKSGARDECKGQRSMEIDPRHNVTGANEEIVEKPYLSFGNSIESSDIGDSIENTTSFSDCSQTESVRESSATEKTHHGSLASLGSCIMEYRNRQAGNKLESRIRSASEEITSRPPMIRQQASVNSECLVSATSNGSLTDSSSQESLPSDHGGGAITYHQYYHVFREGELDQLINKYVENLHIISSYYDHASWCIVAEKVQVWTI